MAIRYQLVMRTGPTPGATYALDESLISIGRDPSNTIPISDPELSRHHAQMMAQGGKIVLEDMGSTNGTMVNGHKITGPHVLKSGEVISFGDQISLAFEAQNFDPDATVASVRPQPAAAPLQSQPVAPLPPPPQQAYAGQVPQGPAPVASPPPPQPTKKRIALPVIIGVVTLLGLCSCGTLFWWIDLANKWCDFFPFLFPGAC